MDGGLQISQTMKRSIDSFYDNPGRNFLIKLISSTNDGQFICQW